MAQPLAKLGGDAKVKYVSWDFKKLLEYFRREPAVAGKVKGLWAIRLSNRVESLQSQARGAGPSPSSPPAASAPASAYAAGSDEAGDSASGAGEDAPGWADYGFASNFVYGRFGDLG